MMVSSPGLSIDTRSTHLNPLPTSTQLSHHTSRERMLSVSSSTSSLSSEHSYHTFQRGSIDLRTKLAYSPSQPPRSPNSPAQTKDRTEGDSPSGRYMISPRLAPSLLPKSPSQAHQPSPSSPTGSLRGFPAGHQPGHVRRRDESASSLTMPFDPYRSRQSPPPNKRASKNGKTFSLFFSPLLSFHFFPSLGEETSYSHPSSCAELICLFLSFWSNVRDLLICALHSKGLLLLFFSFGLWPMTFVAF